MPLGFCCAVNHATESLQLCTGSCWLVWITVSKTTLAERKHTHRREGWVQRHKARFQAALASFVLNINFKQKEFQGVRFPDWMPPQHLELCTLNTFSNTIKTRTKLLQEQQRTLSALIKLHQCCEAEVKWLDYTQTMSAQVKFVCINLHTVMQIKLVLVWPKARRSQRNEHFQLWARKLYLSPLSLGDRHCCKSTAVQSKTHPPKTIASNISHNLSSPFTTLDEKCVYPGTDSQLNYRNFQLRSF